MYNRIEERTGNILAEFASGVEEFMNFASSQPLALSSGGKFYCPCITCHNDKFLTGRKIWNHLYSRGFMENYYIWYMHGEELDVDLGTSHVDTSFSSSNQAEDANVEDDNVEDRYVQMVNDAFPDTSNIDNYYQEDQGNQNAEEPNSEAKKFYDMLDAAKTPLYDGCHEGHSQLFLASRYMNLHADNNMTERGVDQWAELITELLPDENHATESYYEMEKLMRNLALPYHTIDVCIENCMIFWREDEKWDACKFCGTPRYKPSDGRTKIPYSRMWYLPIGDRLKRLYQSEKTASAMRWHAEHESAEGECVILQMRLSGKIFNNYILASPRNPEMFTLDYVQMDLIHLACPVIIRYGL
ncbi:unnamed protein product [Microthlaspi erraticum]|uniref:Transposase-associated domain-containing protein n=1 Tax=Microthlaspi erraticum TaxID=1685480 RepID=A0A6D2JB61_9BRAS|nr:unnamed protein product [Microthlaspi erraticum]